MPRFNHLTIFVTVLVQQIIGFLWYSPAMFFSPWLAGIRKRAEEINQSDPVPFIVAILTSVIFCYTLAWCLQRVGVSTAMDGALVGALVGLGLIGPALTGHYAFIGFRWGLMAVDIGMELVTCAISGALLAGRPVGGERSVPV
jgi:hypothetical protein